MTPTPTGRHGEAEYAIRVDGRLDPAWSAWFDGLDLAPAPDGTTTIHGPADQAALHGVLQQLRDVGLPILSVTRVTADPGDAARRRPAPPLPDERTCP